MRENIHKFLKQTVKLLNVFLVFRKFTFASLSWSQTALSLNNLTWRPSSLLLSFLHFMRAFRNNMQVYWKPISTCRNGRFVDSVFFIMPLQTCKLMLYYTKSPVQKTVKFYWMHGHCTTSRLQSTRELCVILCMQLCNQHCVLRQKCQLAIKSRFWSKNLCAYAGCQTTLHIELLFIWKTTHGIQQPRDGRKLFPPCCKTLNTQDEFSLL